VSYPYPPPGGLARRFWGDASVNDTSVTSLREHSPPHIMARHQILRRATQSAETMRERRQTAQAFLTKKKVGLFRILPPVVFPYFVVANEIKTVCQHRRALPRNFIDSDARPARISVSQKKGSR